MRIPVLHRPAHATIAPMSSEPSLLHFTPVPLARHRTRGWTPDRQLAFIDALSRCGVVAQAARSVGCTPRSAYHLRERDGAESFAAAWDWALEMGLDESLARAYAQIQGRRETPLVRRGQIVGVRIDQDFRVIFAALRALGADRNGKRDAMPHRQRTAQREILAELLENGPFTPAEWAILRPVIASGAGAPLDDAYLTDAPPERP
ncbi:hypothetical protein [Sphingobium sp.]|uniref:hypothetical protein n=1 Tax=Sphingobium sp. TaxID=1912891 RepID=UPI0026272657|nr:hypothetical protein [Sphingobium sp.]